MTTEHQAKTSRKLLIIAVLLGVGIAAAAMIYQQLSAPDGPDASTPQTIPGGDSMIGKSTVDGSDTEGQTRSDEDAGDDPGSSSAELADRAQAGAAKASGAQQTGTAGAFGEGEQRAGYVTDADSGGADNSAGRDIFGATAVPKGEAVTDPIAPDGPEPDPKPPIDPPDDPPDPEIEEETPPPPFEGTWTGRMEANPDVPTTANGLLNCGGADLTKFRVLYNEKLDNYMVFGSVKADAGTLGRVRRFFYSIRGLLTAEGVFAKGVSWALDKRADLANYEVEMSGYFSGTRAEGKWRDNLSCEGKWNLSKQ